MNTIIEKIRAEIEHRRDQNREGENSYYDVNDIKNAGICRHKRILCEELLAKLSDLEKEEKPTYQWTEEDSINGSYISAFLQANMPNDNEKLKRAFMWFMSRFKYLPSKDKSEKPTIQEQPVKTDIVEDLKHYLATTPKEQIEKDWESLKEWGKVGPSVSEFLGWEQPVCEELGEEINRWMGSTDCFPEGVGISPLPKAMEIVERTARHFYELGLADKEKQMMEEWLKDRDGCFWDGVEEGKKAMREQMMKEAVEGVVVSELGAVSLPRCVYEKYDGQKVRIIIVKED